MAQADWVKRRAFAQAYAVGGNATQSALQAGVPKPSAHSMGYRWLRDPEVVALIREELNAEVRSLGPLAVSVLRELLLCDRTPASTRLQAARDVLDRLGWVPPKRQEMVDEGAGRALVEMSIEELEVFVSGDKRVRLDLPSLERLAEAGGWPGSGAVGPCSSP